ncbi:MAG: hypothetical protein KF777_11165 [Planctomycetaceae bacterium]|nr:hypothetical protein [Planctomycetaceae bacterium]
MELHKLETVAKLGLSLTTLATLFLYLIGTAYYRAFLIAFSVPMALVRVDFLDIVAINTRSLLCLFSFAMGYLWARERLFLIPQPRTTAAPSTAQADTDFKFSPLSMTKADGSTIRLPLAEAVALWILVIWSMLGLAGVLAAWYFRNDLVAIPYLLFQVWGFIAYRGLKSHSAGLRALVVGASLCFFAIHAVFAGLEEADSHRLRATIILTNGEFFEAALLVYRSSADIVLVPADSTDAVIVPNGMLQRLSILTD